MRCLVVGAALGSRSRADPARVIHLARIATGGATLRPISAKTGRGPMDSAADIYPARLRIDYPEQLDRLTTLLRIFWAIPIFVILAIVAGGGGGTTVRDG